MESVGSSEGLSPAAPRTSKPPLNYRAAASKASSTPSQEQRSSTPASSPDGRPQGGAEGRPHSLPLSPATPAAPPVPQLPPSGALSTGDRGPKAIARLVGAATPSGIPALPSMATPGSASPVEPPAEATPGAAASSTKKKRKEGEAGGAKGTGTGGNKQQQKQPRSHSRAAAKPPPVPASDSLKAALAAAAAAGLGGTTRQELLAHARQEAKTTAAASLFAATCLKAETNGRQLAQIEYRGRKGYAAEPVRATWTSGPTFMRSALAWSCGFSNELRRLDRLCDAGIVPPPGSAEAQAFGQDGSVGTQLQLAAEADGRRRRQNSGSNSNSNSNSKVANGPSIYGPDDYRISPLKPQEQQQQQTAKASVSLSSSAAAAGSEGSNEALSSSSSSSSGMPFLSPAESFVAGAAAAAAFLTYSNLNNAAAPLPAHVQAAVQLQHLQQQHQQQHQQTMSSAAGTPTAASSSSSFSSLTAGTAGTTTTTTTAGKNKRRGKGTKNNKAEGGEQAAAAPAPAPGGPSQAIIRGPFIPIAVDPPTTTLSVAIVPVTSSGVPVPMPTTLSSFLSLPRLNSGPLNGFFPSFSAGAAGSSASSSSSSASSSYSSSAPLSLLGGGGGSIGVSPTAFAVNASLSALSPSFVMHQQQQQQQHQQHPPKESKKSTPGKKAGGGGGASAALSPSSAPSFFVSSSAAASSSSTSSKGGLAPPAPVDTTFSALPLALPHPNPTGRTVMERARLRVADSFDVPAIMTMIRELAAFEGEPAAVKVDEATLLRDGFGEVPVFHVLLAEIPESLATALTAAEAVRESLSSTMMTISSSSSSSSPSKAELSPSPSAGPLLPLHSLSRHPSPGSVALTAAPPAAAAAAAAATPSSSAAAPPGPISLGAGYCDYEARERYCPVAMAFCHMAYSTWEGRVLYLEDLYVSPPFRRQGLSSLLFTALARAARVSKCARMQWTTLKWNDGAIKAYEGLGATRMDEWEIFRLYHEDIKRIAGMNAVLVPGGNPTPIGGASSDQDQGQGQAAASE